MRNGVPICATSDQFTIGCQTPTYSRSGRASTQSWPGLLPVRKSRQFQGDVEPSHVYCVRILFKKQHCCCYNSKYSSQRLEPN